MTSALQILPSQTSDDSLKFKLNLAASEAKRDRTCSLMENLHRSNQDFIFRITAI
jgi:hypothetical protein